MAARETRAALRAAKEGGFVVSEEEVCALFGPQELGTRASADLGANQQQQQQNGSSECASVAAQRSGSGCSGGSSSGASGSGGRFVKSLSVLGERTREARAKIGGALHRRAHSVSQK